MYRLVIILLLSFSIANDSCAQDCTDLGRTPAKAIPLCGNATYIQQTVPIGNLGTLTNNCGSGPVNNPYWFKFTCYSNGTFPFLITPLNINEDYDWQLFDITNANGPFDVFFDTSLSVGINESGRTGITGTTSNWGTAKVFCAGDQPKFSLEPALQTGHHYLLLITHPTGTNSTAGFKLELLMGSADIIDHSIPALKDGRTYCDGSKVVVRFQHPIKCNSIATDGSDFTILPAAANIVSASGFNCTNNFETDSMVLSMSNPLPAGNYTLVLRKGSDFNTLLNTCDVAINEGQQVNFLAGTLPPFGIDSLLGIACAPDQLTLQLTGNLNSLSIAADGSDFAITGPSTVAVIGADPVFNGSPYSRLIKIKLATPIRVSGNYVLHVQQGSDGNTVVDECGQQISTIPVFQFMASDSIHAAFSYNIHLGCKQDTINYSINNPAGITDYKWRFANSGISSAAAPKIIYTKLGQQYSQLTVSNASCIDTASANILLGNELRAGFEVTDILCPNDKAIFKESSMGDIIKWTWDFGNGMTSNLKDPPVQYYSAGNITTDVPVKLLVQANSGCTDNYTQLIKVVNNCYIAVASAFTPNNDGLNDYLYPINAYKANGLLFRVYNRLGQLIFESKNRQDKWDGNCKGQPAERGVYIWTLHYVDRDTRKIVDQKGTSLLLR